VGRFVTAQAHELFVGERSSCDGALNISYTGRQQIERPALRAEKHDRRKRRDHASD
jgi:hypothetical protein